MKSTPKLIVLHPFLNKPTPSTQRLYLVIFLCLVLLTLLITTLRPAPPPPMSPPFTDSPRLSPAVSTALLHYCTANSTAVDRMTAAEVSTIATTIGHCSPDCNLLVFGLSHESVLWKTLNYGEQRRTVFVDESEYVVSRYEKNFTDIEAYDVQYTTKVKKWKEMIKYARVHRKDQCRPVQNLLFSECQLAINDLPNHLYDIPWDMILIDGPSGYSAKRPGRTAAIFSAAVMSRTQTQTQIQTRVNGQTSVFVHDYGREVERLYSEEFLCKENLVEVIHNLAHFVVRAREGNDSRFDFCLGGDLTSS